MNLDSRPTDHSLSSDNDLKLLIRSRLRIFRAGMRRGGRIFTSPQRRVVILHFGRAGSTVLAQALRSQGGRSRIFDGEVFQNLQRDETALLWVCRRDPYRFLDARSHLASVLYVAEIKVGPKGHLEREPLKTNPGELVAALRERNYELVYLRRGDLLRWVISGAVARDRKQYHASTLLGSTPIELPIDKSGQYNPGQSLREYLLAAAQRDSEISKLVRGIGGLELSFEKHIAPDPNIAAQLFWERFEPGHAFVASKLDLRPTVGPRNIEELLSNAAEVRDHLSGTEFVF